MSLIAGKRLGLRSALSLAWIFVWAALSGYALLTLWLGLIGLFYPYQLDYGEGIVLWFTQELAKGHSIYKGLAGLPLASSNYPPLAMLLSAVLMPLFGDGYLGGRLLNLVSAFFVAWLIFRIVRVETRNTLFGLLSALFFLGSPFIYHWVALFRVDLIGLALTFAGVHAIWMYERFFDHDTPVDRDAGRWLAVAGACFFLALYTKQTLLAGPVAAFLVLFARKPKTALVFGAALGVLCGALFLALEWLTAGGFAFGLVESNATVFLPEQLANILQQFALTFPVLLALALLQIGRQVRLRRLGILHWYAVTSSLVLVLAGRIGAWENYFFEAIAALCVLGMIALIHLVRRFSASPVAAVAMPILLLVQLALFWHDPRIASEMVSQDWIANRQLAQLLAKTAGPVISEDMGALATSGKPVSYYTFQYSMLARSGKWDQAWELNGLANGAFPLVILERGTREDVDHYRRFTREFISALDRYYERRESIGKFQIYSYAPLAHGQRVSFGETIDLVGWSAQPQGLSAGVLEVTVVWEPRRGVDIAYKQFLHLQNTSGTKLAQQDQEPLEGNYSTTRWAIGENIRDVLRLNIPENLPPGDYDLRIGWYDPESGDRLTAPASPDNAFVLTRFHVGNKTAESH